MREYSDKDRNAEENSNVGKQYCSVYFCLRSSLSCSLNRSYRKLHGQIMSWYTEKYHLFKLG